MKRPCGWRGRGALCGGCARFLRGGAPQRPVGGGIIQAAASGSCSGKGVEAPPPPIAELNPPVFSLSRHPRPLLYLVSQTHTPPRLRFYRTETSWLVGWRLVVLVSVEEGASARHLWGETPVLLWAPAPPSPPIPRHSGSLRRAPALRCWPPCANGAPLCFLSSFLRCSD